MGFTMEERTGRLVPVVDADEDAPLPVGTVVEVRSRFDRRWARGFAVVGVEDGTYQLRRLSDGSVLPAWFDREDLRAHPA